MRNIVWKRRISGTNTWLTVSKNDEVKLLWDNEHPMWSCHHCYNRHDHVVVNKQVDKDCRRIIRKCDEELGEVAGKLDIRISILLPPKKLRH